MPGGGISLEGQRWIACRPTFLLPVRVLSRLFRRLLLKMLTMGHKTGRLAFFGNRAALAEKRAFAAFLAPLRKTEWVVYANMYRDLEVDGRARHLKGRITHRITS